MTQISPVSGGVEDIDRALAEPELNARACAAL